MKRIKQASGDRESIAHAVERAIQALDQLEEVLDAGDNYKIGARLQELRRALEQAKQEVGNEPRRTIGD